MVVVVVVVVVVVFSALHVTQIVLSKHYTERAAALLAALLTNKLRVDYCL